MFLVITMVFAKPYYFQTFYLKVIRMRLAIFQILSNIYTQAMLEEAYELGKTQKIIMSSDVNK
ncbi:hypothetical protein HMPREF9248_1205 [Fannyhessea vaginae PB189-T1-4]|uniref:Uncharacterized protein n=1 Tax=Fannyhessea vaginae PB189-T1-4 TaxID=866774 RepID=A0ABN0B1B8_9ACTN|nr:hypothetical protein HMPREF9248_1205 [Fannyhessea vaginae PB189-T1-4]